MSGTAWEVDFKCADGKGTRDCRLVVEADGEFDAEVQAEEAVRRKHEGCCIEETPCSLLIFRLPRRRRKSAKPWMRYFGFTARKAGPASVPSP